MVYSDTAVDALSFQLEDLVATGDNVEPLRPSHSLSLSPSSSPSSSSFPLGAVTTRLEDLDNSVVHVPRLPQPLPLRLRSTDCVRPHPTRSVQTPPLKNHANTYNLITL